MPSQHQQLSGNGPKRQVGSARSGDLVVVSVGMCGVEWHARGCEVQVCRCGFDGVGVVETEELSRAEVDLRRVHVRIDGCADVWMCQSRRSGDCSSGEFCANETERKERK